MSTLEQVRPQESVDIHGRAMLVTLRISTWTARKYDKRISDETNRAHGATSDAGRYNKMLLPGDCASYKALMKKSGDIRTMFYANTLAWQDNGYRLLPSANYMTLAANIRSERREWESLRDTFISEYPYLRDAAKVRLNGMYKDEDYPSTAEIENKFGMYFDKMPLPAHGDFRLDGLPLDELQSIEQETQSRIHTSVNEAMSDAWNRLRDCVKHIHERTSNPDAIFRDTLIYNARELCDVLSRLNITGDANLEAFRREIENDLAANDPDTIRENQTVRNDTAILAEDILSRMAGFYQG